VADRLTAGARPRGGTFPVPARRCYLETTPKPTQEQLAFVWAFDLGYRERRIRFVIKGINELYRRVDARPEPPCATWGSRAGTA
jgi:hypothetical protein